MDRGKNKAIGAVRRCLRHLTWLTTPDPDGDTIIEVMVVLAVLGLAVGICYATANRSLLNTRQAQENTIAATYVQSQIEALRTMATNTVSSGNDIFTQDQAFCINTTTAGSYTIVDSSNATTYKSPASSGGCQADSPPYTLGITYNSSANDPGTFTVTAQWPDVLGQGTDTVTEYYRLHGPAVAVVTPPPPPTGSSSTCDGQSQPTGLNEGAIGNPTGDTPSGGSPVWFKDFTVAPGDTDGFPLWTTTDQKVSGGYHGGSPHKPYLDAGTFAFSMPVVICFDQAVLQADFNALHGSSSPITSPGSSAILNAVAFPDTGSGPDYRYPQVLTPSGYPNYATSGCALQQDGSCWNDQTPNPPPYGASPNQSCSQSGAYLCPYYFETGQIWFSAEEPNSPLAQPLSYCAYGPPGNTACTAKIWDIFVYNGYFISCPGIAQKTVGPGYWPPIPGTGSCGPSQFPTSPDGNSYQSSLKDWPPDYYVNYVQYDISSWTTY